MSVRSGKGDGGFTDLPFHKIIEKDSSEIRALGDLDELMSFLGLLKSKLRSGINKDLIEGLQKDIFVIASEIAGSIDKKKKSGILLGKTRVDRIKKTVSDLEKKIKIKGGFYLPGTGELSAFFDVNRAVARRAERSVVSLLQNDKFFNRNILTYMNCISDVLFLLARKYP
ncbi:MAG: cob(I)yrinic acid a,c-diamide adenosyltransferase [Candidatus Omnitrophota bacterium]